MSQARLELRFMEAVKKAIGPGAEAQSTPGAPAEQAGGGGESEMKTEAGPPKQGFMSRMVSAAGNAFDSVYQVWFLFWCLALTGEYFTCAVLQNSMIPLGKLKILPQSQFT